MQAVAIGYDDSRKDRCSQRPGIDSDVVARSQTHAEVHADNDSSVVVEFEDDAAPPAAETVVGGEEVAPAPPAQSDSQVIS